MPSITKNEKYILLLAASIIICIFRIPILAPFSLQSLTVVLNFAPLLLTILAFFFIKSDRSFNKYLLGLTGFSLLYLVIFLINVAISAPSELMISIRDLSSTTAFLMFPLLLDKAFSKNELVILLKKIIPYLIVIAFVLTLSELLLLRFHVFTIDEISMFLRKKVTTKPTRLITFMSLGAISMLSILALFSYIFNKTLKMYESSQKLYIWGVFLILVSFSNILISDSITLILSSFVLLGFSLVLSIRNSIKEYKLSLKQILIFIVLLVVFYKISSIVFFSTELRDRYIGYFHNGELQQAIDIWFPRTNGCELSTLLTSFPILKNVNLNDNCVPGEFHSVLIAFRYGFIMQAAWFGFILYPVYYFLTNLKNIFRLSPYFFGSIAFVLPLVHYSGVEIWGNNYIAALFIVLLIRDNDEAKALAKLS